MTNIGKLLKTVWMSTENENICIKMFWKHLMNKYQENIYLPKSKPEWLVAELGKYMKDRDSLLKKARRT